MAGMAKHVEWSPCGVDRPHLQWIEGLAKNLGRIYHYSSLFRLLDFYGIKKAVVTIFYTSIK